MSDISLTLGPQFWGLVVSTLLLGVALVQGYIYYANNRDGWLMHIYVFVMLTLDVSTTALVSEALYYYLITSAGNPSALLVIRSTFYAEIFLSTINIFLSQQFYASRIYKSRTSRIGQLAGYVVSILSAVSIGFGLAALYELHASGLKFSSLVTPKYKILLSLGFYIDTLCNLFATFSMCYFLSSYHTVFKTTKDIVNWLFFFAINRSFLVGVTTCTCISLYLAYPLEGYWVPFHFLMPKLHVNTLLAMLNSRKMLRDRMDGRINILERSGDKTPNHYLTAMRSNHAIDIKKSTGVYVSVDKHVSIDPERITRNSMPTNPSLTTCGEEHGHSAIELSDFGKGASIA